MCFLQVFPYSSIVFPTVFPPTALKPLGFPGPSCSKGAIHVAKVPDADGRRKKHRLFFCGDKIMLLFMLYHVMGIWIIQWIYHVIMDMYIYMDIT